MSKQNLLPYDEVVDTFADAIEVAEIVRVRLADGAGFDDIFAIYESYPKLIEIYQDRKTFWAQFEDLTAEELASAYDDLAARFGMEVSKIESYALQSFDIAAEAWALINYNISAVQSLIFKAKRLIGRETAA